MQPTIQPSLHLPHRAPKKRRYILGIIVGIFVLLMSAAGAWLWSLERSATAPIRASDAFLRYLLSGDSERAYELTSDSFREVTGREDLAQTANTVKDGLKQKTLKIIEGTREDDEERKKATIKYEIEGGDGKYRLEVRLHTEANGQDWRIAGVDSTRQE